MKRIRIVRQPSARMLLDKLLRDGKRPVSPESFAPLARALHARLEWEALDDKTWRLGSDRGVLAWLAREARASRLRCADGAWTVASRRGRLEVKDAAGRPAAEWRPGVVRPGRLTLPDGLVLEWHASWKGGGQWRADDGRVLLAFESVRGPHGYGGRVEPDEQLRARSDLALLAAWPIVISGATYATHGG